jgi:hypothetical protein
MTLVEYLVRAVGLFYALGAIFLIRQMAVSDLMDRVIAAIDLTHEDRRHTVRRWLLGAGAALTGASGVAALLLSSWALPLFAANLILQVSWLVWAARAFPPEDAEDALGRRRTLNAAFFYATVTVTVFALALEGGLRPWTEWQSAVPVAAAMLAYFVYLVRCLRQPANRARDDRPEPVDDDDFDPAKRGDDDDLDDLAPVDRSRD